MRPQSHLESSQQGAGFDSFLTSDNNLAVSDSLSPECVSDAAEENVDNFLDSGITLEYHLFDIVLQAMIPWLVVTYVCQEVAVVPTMLGPYWP